MADIRELDLDSIPDMLDLELFTPEQFHRHTPQAAAPSRTSWPDERPLNSLGNPVGTRVAHWRRMAGFGAEDAES